MVLRFLGQSDNISSLLIGENLLLKTTLIIYVALQNRRGKRAERFLNANFRRRLYALNSLRVVSGKILLFHTV